MALTHDTLAQSAAELASATTQTIVYTPLATIIGVVCMIVQAGVGDQVSGVTYDGVAMRRVGLVSGTAGLVYFYALESGLPAGTAARNCVVTSTGVAPKWSLVAGVTSNVSTSVRAFVQQSRTSASQANPVLDWVGSVGAGSSFPAFGGQAYYAAHSGGANVPTVFNGTNMATHDFGTTTSVFNRNAAGNNDAVSCGYTATAATVADGLLMLEEAVPPDLLFGSTVTV